MVLAVATVLVVWLVIAPSDALAMPTTGAPVCDVRGATTFAPPPQIQDAELSLDIPADCLDLGALDLRLVKNFAPGHHAPPQLTSTQEPASVGHGLSLELTFSERTPAPAVEKMTPPRGVTLSLDRPPRA